MQRVHWIVLVLIIMTMAGCGIKAKRTSEAVVFHSLNSDAAMTAVQAALMEEGFQISGTAQNPDVVYTDWKAIELLQGPARLPVPAKVVIQVYVLPDRIKLHFTYRCQYVVEGYRQCNARDAATLDSIHQLEAKITEHLRQAIK